MDQEQSSLPSKSDADQETEMILNVQAGDRGAFSLVVNKYWDPLYRWLFHMTCNRHRAEDLTQESFLKALSGIRSFKPGSNFRAWLFRIAHNNFINLKRSERRNVQSIANEGLDPADEKDSVTEQTIHQEILERVQQAIRSLPQEFQAALMLRVDLQMSFKEVADVMNITEETARWRVFKARQKLMQQLGPENLPDSFRDS